jgi:hypothetical protein
MRLYLPNGIAKRTIHDVCGPGRVVGEPEFEPDDVLVVELDPPPSEAEKTAIRRKVVTTDAADEQHLADLLASYADKSAPLWARVLIETELKAYGEGPLAAQD